MNCFNRIANQLSMTIRQQKSVHISFWGNKTWGDLFEQEIDGLAIKPKEVAGLFSPKILAKLKQNEVELADLPPEVVEQVLCEQYKVYKNTTGFWGFWSRFWMRITQPINIYRQVYTLITLRNLQKSYAAVGEEAKRISQLPRFDSRAWNNLFVRTIESLSTYLASLIPSDLSFFQQFFKSKVMHSHVIELKQFKKDALKALKNEIKQSYLELVKKASVCSIAKEQELLNQEIQVWWDTHANSIRNNISGIREKDTAKYNGLLESLRIKSGLLVAIVEEAKNRAISPVAKESLAQDMREAVDRKYEYLAEKLMNLEDGCTVQIDNTNGLHRHTYVLRRNYFNRWQLSYRETAKKNSREYELSDVPGLEAVLSESSLSLDTIKPLIISFHHHHVALNKMDSASPYHKEVLKSSPKHCEKLLLLHYSQQLEYSLKRQQEIRDTDLLACARQLHACYDYMQEKTADCLERYNTVEEMTDRYLRLSKNTSKKAAATKIQCMDLMVFNPPSQHPQVKLNEFIEQLRADYLIMHQSEDFLQLSLRQQRYLKQAASLDIRRIHDLIPVFQTIQTPGKWTQVAGFFNSLVSAEWEKKIRDDFEKAWAGIAKTDNSAVRATLRNTARDCFIHYVTRCPSLISELRNIYLKIEQVRVEYLPVLEQQTREIILFPPRKNPGLMPLRSLVNILDEPDKMHLALPRLLMEFKEELRISRHHSQCAWIRLSTAPDAKMINALPICFNPAYIYVEKTMTLYYVDKEILLRERQEPLLEEINLTKEQSTILKENLGAQISGSILSQDQAIFITELTNHSYDKKIYLYSVLLQLLAYRAEGIMWGIWPRDIHIDTRCGLLWASENKIRSELERLPYSHYIYTPGKELLYYCKHENTLEKRVFLTQDEQEIFDQTYPEENYHYIKELELSQLKHIRSLYIGEYRNEEHEVTSERACKMAKNEVGQLFKALSLLYHPDKYSGAEKFQALIVHKKAEADKRLDDLLLCQEVLIKKFNLLREEAYTVPSDLKYYIPAWIVQCRQHNKGINSVMVDYCTLLKEDGLTKKSELKSQEMRRELKMLLKKNSILKASKAARNTQPNFTASKGAEPDRLFSVKSINRKKSHDVEARESYRI